MEKYQFNGPDFHYNVMWRRVVGSGPKWHMSNTTAPPFVVNDVGNFSAFEIKVQAVNAIKEGPEPDPAIGYSGEDGTIHERKCFPPMHIFILVRLSLALFIQTLSLSLSSTRGSDRCGCCTNQQHCYQSDLGNYKQRDGQRTPDGIQGAVAQFRNTFRFVVKSYFNFAL